MRRLSLTVALLACLSVRVVADEKKRGGIWKRDLPGTDKAKKTEEDGEEEERE